MAHGTSDVDEDGALTRQYSEEQAVEELEKMAHLVEQLEEHDAVLEIDNEAKEALLEEVMQERDELLDERDQLQCELEALKRKLPVVEKKTQSGLKRSITSLSRNISGLLTDPTSGPTCNSSPKSLKPVFRKSATAHFSTQSRSPDSDEEKLCLDGVELAEGHRAILSPDDSKVPTGNLVLDGFFQGKVRTGLHVLDVALPVEGGVPGLDLVGLARALNKSSFKVESPRTPRSVHGIWGKLAQVLKQDLESLEDSCNDTGKFVQV